jgi:uncharacterized protein DUF6527
VTLLELQPHFIVLVEGGDEVGMTFRCPHCPPGERGETTYLGIWFSDPVERADHPHVDWPTYMLQHPEHKYWRCDGAEFATMTVTPSIDASRVGHWHGFITNGQVT